ncbi:hypothetical protein Pmar_PMAR017880 [Perkinsus marinus ATCC 50983]|uniref:Uncharacterized protein n=1 Tax=Perkinsus marinus (strain ATCC 50983 / TXsc) TaxID=423536 RepID=C5KEV7_PERM5|nr:hypothetical protein Pmar_PMAR017880 [Perkinsus marinus ATCC 50983]EER16983.1 hypothetical protein Pmar_PMAR017880 [Perkinsus marinus ATCC 50983]|eukprot:XP_002785187.1 hypothetical protein Pmar_PMAR017880 [Perkinsus marinus ATCC 50983]
MSMHTAYLRYRYAVLDFATVGPVKFGLIDVRDFTDVNKSCEVHQRADQVTSALRAVKEEREAEVKRAIVIN